MERKRVVILGGGFAGLYAARALKRADVRITLVDRHNYHLFQPLLYQVATGALSETNIAQPLRKLLYRQDNTEVLMAHAREIRPDDRTVLLDNGAIDYDYLLVATGAQFSYFGHDDWATHAPGLKSIQDAIDIRRRVFRAFEAAEREGDADARSEWMTFVIVGAGPTGVELAGTLAEIARRTLTKDFRHIDPAEARVILVDALPTVLPAYAEPLQRKAIEQLEKLGVEVKTKFMVDHIDDASVRSKDGEALAARTVLWSAGVEGTPIARSLGVELHKSGKVKVNRDLTVPGHPEIFVAGDLAYLEQDGEPIPGLAPAAIQQGKHVAGNIKRALAGDALEPFEYWDKGSFAVIGRGAAVGEVFARWKLDGFIAWIAWLVIHLYFLVGFQNRMLVMFQWAFAYLTHRRGARIINSEVDFELTKPRPTHEHQSPDSKTAAA